MKLDVAVRFGNVTRSTVEDDEVDMTALRAALEKAGYSKPSMEAYAWASRFIEQGGTREAWIEAYDRAAEKLPREGQYEAAANGGHHPGADPRPPLSREGQRPNAAEGGRSMSADSGRHLPAGGHRTSAVPSGQGKIASGRRPIASGGGQKSSVSHDLIAGAHPAREPSAGQRDAAAKVAKTIAITVLDTTKTADGKRWGDVIFYELGGMLRDGAIAKMVRYQLGEVPVELRDRRLRELITPDDFKSVLIRAARINE